MDGVKLASAFNKTKKIRQILGDAVPPREKAERNGMRKIEMRTEIDMPPSAGRISFSQLFLTRPEKVRGSPSDLARDTESKRPDENLTRSSLSQFL